MKVLHVYKDYYPPVLGGIEGHLNLLARGLKQVGVQTEVLVSNTRPALKKEIIDGIPITKVPQLFRFNSAPFNYSLPIWLRKLATDADIIHFQFPNPTGEIAYLLSGVGGRMVVSYQSDIVRQKITGKLLSPLLKRFLNRAHAILVASPNYIRTSAVLQQFRDKCVVVPLGIEVDRFACDSATASQAADIRLRYNSKIVLFIGKFRYYKGLSVLIQAASQLDCTLLLIGSGPLEKELRKQVEACHLSHRIHFLGDVSDKEKKAYLHACDVFVLPSIYRSEAYGIAQLEAMACGKPVICTELGTGTSFINQHRKTGLVVPPNDTAALVAALKILLRDSRLREQYGRAGNDRASRIFSQEKMVATILRVYQDILGKYGFQDR